MTIRLDDDVREQLESYADSIDRSVNWCVNQLIRRQLQAIEITPMAEGPTTRWMVDLEFDLPLAKEDALDDAMEAVCAPLHGLGSPHVQVRGPYALRPLSIATYRESGHPDLPEVSTPSYSMVPGRAE